MTVEAILVFARAPTRGEVKTRLVSHLGEERTLSLYRAFLSDTLDLARSAAPLVFLSHTPADPFREMAKADVAFEQRGDGFGARFDHALASAWKALPRGARLLVIGADTPHLTPFSVRRAFRALDRDGAVLGPTEDGGFYLLGTTSPPPPLGHCFGDPPVARARVRSALSAAAVSVVEMDLSFDIDTPRDLVRLSALLRSGGGAAGGWLPPATARLLLAAGGPQVPQRSVALRTAAIPDPSA